MESVEDKKKMSFVERWKTLYRLIIVRDDTFEEKFTLRLTRLSVIGFATLLTVLLVIITSLIIVFTPIREYIPGYSDVNLDRKLRKLAHKTDSLEDDFRQKQLYLENIQKIVKGERANDKLPEKPTGNKGDDIIINDKSVDEMNLRKEMEEHEKFNLVHDEAPSNQSSIRSFIFFSPINGIISDKFNAQEKHYGVDVVSKKNDFIKATLDGTVIMAEWTLETGYVIAIQHNANIVSIYKHNSAILKKAGAYVRAGDVISIIGDSGELTTGPHLHFELWYNGNPVNPEEYMLFSK